MAKPIKSTPELVGDEANKFLRKMIQLESSKVTSQQRKFAKEIRQNMNLLVVS